jgi:Skp family chaperone for outer membrane proteins
MKNRYLLTGMALLLLTTASAAGAERPKVALESD